MERFLKSKIISISTILIIVLGISLGTNVEAKENNNTGKAKNVIFLIPDGFSSSFATNYRWYKGKDSIMDSMLVGMHRTYSANSEVTDSAAAATAMATGVKTNNGMISISPEGKKLKTILEVAKDAGKSTGLVATSTITYATPAAFAAHVPSRLDEADIATQLINNEVDVLLGGGKKYFPESLLHIATKGGYHFVSDRNELMNVKTADKLIGLFSNVGMAPELDRHATNEPSLADMTEVALKVLEKNKEGFFLMVEGSQIDWAGHDNDAAWAMKDIEAFEEALAKVLEFAKKDKKTLIVIAGDHDTGGMSVGGYGLYDAKVEILREVKATGDFMVSQLNVDRTNVKEVVKRFTSIDLTDEQVKKIKETDKADIAINEMVSERALVGWTTKQHTGVDVPLYAYGPGSNMFRGLHNNTDLPVMMAKAMKIKFYQTK